MGQGTYPYAFVLCSGNLSLGRGSEAKIQSVLIWINLEWSFCLFSPGNWELNQWPHACWLSALSLSYLLQPEWSWCEWNVSFTRASYLSSLSLILQGLRFCERLCQDWMNEYFFFPHLYACHSLNPVHLLWCHWASHHYHPPPAALSMTVFPLP